MFLWGQCSSVVVFHASLRLPSDANDGDDRLPSYPNLGNKTAYIYDAKSAYIQEANTHLFNAFYCTRVYAHD